MNKHHCLGSQRCPAVLSMHAFQDKPITHPPTNRERTFLLVYIGPYFHKGHYEVKGGQQRRKICRWVRECIRSMCALSSIGLHANENVEMNERDEDGRRLQWGSSTVIVPEAALSGTIPQRPLYATATAEMPEWHDIHSELSCTITQLWGKLSHVSKYICMYDGTNRIRRNTPVNGG